MVFDQISGTDLFQRCAGSRDHEAWAEFHRRYHRLIAGVVAKTLTFARMAVTDEIDDLIHDVYVRLSMNGGRALRSYIPTGPASEYSFLKVIARNLVLDHLAHKKREPSPAGEPGDQESVPTDGPSPSEALERKLLVDKIEQIVRTKATDRDRMVFWLYYRSGLTAAQISTLPTVGLSTSGVESAIARLVRIVRETLGEGAPEWKR